MSQATNHKKKSLGQMRLASIGALAITLTILGFIALIRILAIGLEQEVKEQITFDIELPENYNKESYLSLEPELKKIRGISNIQFVSQDEALEAIKPQLGENPEDLLGYNPLNPLIRLNISGDYLQSDSLKKIQSIVSGLGLDATSLNNRQTEQLDKVNKNVSVLEIVLWGLVAVQALFAFIQINNTTRLNIYAERLKIRSLTLVGASAWFIRRPLIARSLVDGLIATLLSLCLLGLSLWGIEYGLDTPILQLLDKVHLGIAIVGLLALALLSCGLASYRATQRYIKMDGKRIHLV